MGTGYILADLSLSNIRLDEDLNVPRKNYLANGEFDKIKAQYKYPVNAAFGISRPFGKVRMYGSVSWFGKIKTYNILDPGDCLLYTSYRGPVCFDHGFRTEFTGGS